MVKEMTEVGRKMSKSKKFPVKTKIATAYERIFVEGKDPSTENANFWDEFFMLWAIPEAIQKHIAESSVAKLVANKAVIRKTIAKCIQTCSAESSVRTVNSIQVCYYCSLGRGQGEELTTFLQTLRGLINGVCLKEIDGSTILDILFGTNAAPELFQLLLERISELLLGEFPPSMKHAALNLLLTIISAFSDLSKNVFLEYFLATSVFEALVQLLGNTMDRQNHGKFAVLLIALLANYRKHDNVNPYIVKLSILDDELALNGYSNVIASCLCHHNQQFQQRLLQSEPSGMFSSLTNMVGSIFVADHSNSDKVQRDECLLLAMYEAVHLNRNFITTLTSVSHMNGENGEASAVVEAPSDPLAENLCVAFLTYCSVILHDLKSERSRNAAKLSVMILSCIAEDQYANALMHDINMAFRVPLYRAPMRHRKGALDRSAPLRPLACVVLDLCVEFLLSHMMRKNMPVELYTWILSTVHRILCYEKKCRVRLNFDWRELWNALIGVLRFVVQNQVVLINEFDIFTFCCKINVILNLFITFGDTFLPSADSYDYLYYEIVRQAEVFDNLLLLANQYTEQSSGNWREGAVKLGNTLVNIRSIIAHFRPKIDSLGLTTLTEDTVLEVVKGNYETLTLKLHENLDAIDRYNEKSNHTPFFNEMIRLIVLESRTMVGRNRLDQVTVISELSTISSPAAR